jgi:hypothetical protein
MASAYSDSAPHFAARKHPGCFTVEDICRHLGHGADVATDENPHISDVNHHVGKAVTPGHCIRKDACPRVLLPCRRDVPYTHCNRCRSSSPCHAKPLRGQVVPGERHNNTRELGRENVAWRDLMGSPAIVVQGRGRTGRAPRL